MTPRVEARGLALAGRLAPTDLVAEVGEMVALVGPNGGGKTSLLRALARVEDAAGTVRIDGEDVDSATEARRARLLAFLPASRDIAWPIRVRDIVALGGAEAKRVDGLLDQLALTALSDRPIGSLSTGERTRALLARAIAARPRLLLLDEPLAHLDPYWALRILDLLAAQARGGAAVLVALHDLQPLDRFDRLLLIDGGKVVGDGQPEMLRGDVAALFGVEPDPGGGWRLPIDDHLRSS